MQLLSYTRFLFQNSGYFQSCRKHSFNCTHFIKVNEIKMYSTGIRNFNRGRFYSRFIVDDRHRKLYNLTYANILVHSVKAALKKMPVLLKGHSMNIVKHCAEQCEFIIAHRIRRSQQIISLYTKLWDEMALKHFVSKLRRKFVKKGKLMLLSIGLFNWDKERITTEEVERYQNELEVIKELKRKKYCRKTGEGKCDCFNCLEPGELEWNTFVEQENLTVWKKEESNHKGEGLYCYKMYGRYDDVTALDFLEAQVDLDYRLTWDDHAVKLKTIDTERNTRSDVIYWETKWPALFSNRDYVFKRRYHIDQKRKMATLVNKSTEHPTCPPYPNKQRITEYWSYMVIKPYEDLDKPGIEFSLTYFDNPGISMPSSLSTYVTVTGMPLFLKHLHDAAIKLKDVRKTSILFDAERNPDEKRSSDGKKKPPSSADDSPSSSETKKKCPKLPDLPKTNFQRLCDSFFFF